MHSTSLAAAATALIAEPDLAAGLWALARALPEELALLRLGVATVEVGGPFLRVVETAGDPAGPAGRGGARMPREGSANGHVVRTGQPHVNLDLPGGTPRFLEEHLLRAQGARAFLCLPARRAGAVLGTLNVALRAAPAAPEELLADLQHLADLVGAALHRMHLESEVRRLSDALRRRSQALDADLDRLGALQPLGESPAFRACLREVERAAVVDASVLLLGATGTGKEVLARHLHRMSARAEGPFVAVNCAALPEALVESELFGHRRGAFTGAEQDRQGLFVKAGGGTLLLDEVGELTLPVQAKLLRALDQREVVPVGSDEPVATDVRIVAATHRDLHAMVEAGAFRRDLYYRLVALPVRVPSLAERREDIPLLVRAFLASACARMARPEPAVRPGVLATLQRREYPGNVRELRNLVERALVYSGDSLELPADELPRVGGGREPQARAEGASWPTLDEVQREHIERTLAHTRGKFYGTGGAAELLGMAPSSLKSRMQRLGIPTR